MTFQLKPFKLSQQGFCPVKGSLNPELHHAILNLQHNTHTHTVYPCSHQLLSRKVLKLLAKFYFFLLPFRCYGTRWSLSACNMEKLSLSFETNGEKKEKNTDNFAEMTWDKEGLKQ